MSCRSFRSCLPVNEVNSTKRPAQPMFQASSFLAKLTDLETVARIGMDTSSPLEKNINCWENYNCYHPTPCSEAYKMNLPRWTTFHTHTMMIDTFCEKVNARRRSDC